MQVPCFRGVKSSEWQVMALGFELYGAAVAERDLQKLLVYFTASCRKELDLLRPCIGLASFDRNECWLVLALLLCQS